SGLNKSNGIISLAGRSLSEKERLKETAYVMQEISLQLFSDSVKKELLLGNQQKKNYQKIADNLGLQDLLQRHPLSLSGGEQQRVLIGNALLSDKKIFIFDEPTSGLDYEHMLAVGKLLQELKAAGKIVLVITHDKELVTTVCDYQLDFANYISNE
ncbi:MAG: ATP-binding cassette domain-containing protein, partial [Streptococcus gallolyticus]|nr:ATP-binding cassette domain-containing protein [Streptococcus gallolyticus]